jgi:hypothetical protein
MSNSNGHKGVLKQKLIRNLKAYLLNVTFPFFLLGMLAGGCAAASRNPVPKEAANAARLPNLNETRVVLNANSTNALHDLARLMKGFDSSGGADKHLNFLALSGGGENAAYGAGVLCGWTEAGTRPQFDLVTGISTGSLIAPLAFLGAEFVRASGSRFHYISMPPEFQTELKEPFDTEYMKALFDVGNQQGRNGIPGPQTPPGLTGLDRFQASAPR